ncbi:MAG: thioredoxin domain-containing protein [Anaerolineaceae bacterium]|nr:thioredoxin domain-containing protein [Anaerolineaceae bacterium]
MTANASDLFTVDPDFDPEAETDNTDVIEDGTIIYDQKGKQIYPPITPVIINADGSMENTECEVSNPLLDSVYYRDLVGEITEKDWVKGPDDAIMTIIEYADFQCPGCADSFKDLKAYQEDHADEVRIVYRHYPLAQHDLSLASAYFSEAAGKQGLFFEFADFLYDTQSDWSSLSESGFEKWISENAPKRIPELDPVKLIEDYADNEMHEDLETNLLTAVDSGMIAATPTLLINYSPFSNGFSRSSADKWLGLLRYGSRLYTECPDLRIDIDTDYRAVIETTKGTIEADLYEKESPLAVANIIFLAENGWFDDMPISAVLDDYAVQFGDPSATGYLTSGYNYKKEQNASDVEIGLGYITMYESAKDKNSSIVLIWLDPMAYYIDILGDSDDLTEEVILDYAEGMAISDLNKQTIIGKVTEDTYGTAAQLTETDVIRSIRIERN